MTRTDTTLWELMIWAYQKQLVRRGGRGVSLASVWSTTGLALRAMELGATVQGSGSGASATPEDALTVAAVVDSLAQADRRLIVEHAELGAPPDWDPRLPAFRAVPVLKNGSGALRMVYGRASRSSEPIACRIDYVGFDDARAESVRREARAMYDQLHGALVRVWPVLAVETALTHWRVTRLGLPARPWRKSRLTSGKKLDRAV